MKANLQKSLDGFLLLLDAVDFISTYRNIDNIMINVLNIKSNKFYSIPIKTEVPCKKGE